MFRQGHDPGPITPLVWAKVASSLSVLNEQAFLTTFDRIVQHWRPMPTDQLATYETGFKTLQTLLEGRPTLVAQLVRHLRVRHAQFAWTISVTNKRMLSNSRLSTSASGRTSSRPSHFSFWGRSIVTLTRSREYWRRRLPSSGESMHSRSAIYG